MERKINILWEGIMLEAINYENIKNEIETDCTIGILIGHPTSEFIQSILRKLSYFHHRSGESINFYFPGYGTYWYGTYYDEEKVCKIDNIYWSFSSKMFSNFISDMENESKWEYSGESELILINYKNGDLDFSETIVFYLDQMIKEKHISSVEMLFENIFRYFKRNNSLYKYSDKRVGSQLSTDVLGVIKEKILPEIFRMYDNSKIYCIRDLS